MFTIGYWRSDSFVKKIYSCSPFSGSCLPQEKYFSNICDPAYIGPLCQTCNLGYGKKGIYCDICYNTMNDMIVILLIFLAFTIILVVYIK